MISASSSHAEGYQSRATKFGSHAEGVGTDALSDCQHVQGRFNLSDTAGKYLDIIGNGDSNVSRSNASTVDRHGNAWFSGDVYTGSTSGTNKDEGSKKLATEEYVDNVKTQAIEEATSNDVIVKGNGDHSIIHSNGSTVSDGSNSIALGYNTKSYNECCVTMGYENANYSHCGINLGMGNVSGLEKYKDTQWNANGAIGCTVLGWGNKVTHSFSTVFGDHNISSNLHQSVFGTCCAENPDALFIVGNGYESDKINRSNLFEVTNSSVIHNGVALPAEEEGECNLNLAGKVAKSQYHRVGNSVNITYYTSMNNAIANYTVNVLNLPFVIRTTKSLIGGQGFVTLDSKIYPLVAKGINNDTFMSLWMIVDNQLNRVSHSLLTELNGGSTDYTADIELNIQYLTEV